MGRIRVLLVDDHPVVLAGLMATLSRDHELEVVGKAGDGVEALEAAAELRPDVVLMDLRLPNLNGIEATRQIKDLLPATEVIVLSVYDHDAYVARAMRAGARGYIIKDAPPALICRTIKAVHGGGHPKVIARPRVQRDNLNADADPWHNHDGDLLQQFRTLTPREREVLKQVVEGLTNREIARTLFISEVTAKKHVQSIIAKLDSSDRTQAAVRAVRAGLLDF
ncbi:MAG: response regulator transcription factor [Chloroflexi bacterium]|nr:response regulator transcription factor [Chloroflexota bacterium]